MRRSGKPCMGRQRALPDLLDFVAGQAGNVERESLVARPVKAPRRLRRRPRATEQRQIAMMEDVEEIAERGVASMVLTFARNLGDVDRQRAVGPEHPESEEKDSETLVVHG